jgi:N-acetylmuramoyl-L-alanine amidase
MVVLHYTGMQTGEEALDRLCDAEAEVSAHYMIDEDGTVTALVPEDKRAWHAGRAYWRGITDVNSASIGIELVNPGHEWGYRPFSDAQMEALVPLLADIVRRHGIAPANVVGHSDVAPARKTDPGELFDWDLLARYRLALAAQAAHAPDLRQRRRLLSRARTLWL